MDVTASEIVGELKKAARLFEVFQEAHKMVAVVAELEQVKAKAQKQVDALRTERDKMDAEIDEKVNKANVEVIAAKEDVKNMREVLAMTKVEAQKLLSKAQEEATQIVTNAKNQAKEVEDSIASLRGREAEAERDLLIMKASLAMIVDEMHSKKQQILKAFN